MDITSGAGYPASALSNFAHHDFVFDGVECASMEGLLQSFKFRDREKQLALCRMTGIQAKRAGREGNGWRSTGLLYWDGVQYDRLGRPYGELLLRAYNALLMNDDFRRALIATGTERLTHRIGVDDPMKTILTAREFCGLLMWLRAETLALTRK